VLLEGVAVSVGAHVKSLQDSHEDLLESFQVPVLVNDSMDDPGEENLLGLVGE